MPKYYVVTPEYEMYAQNDIDPSEYGADVIEVEATTKREAIKLGVKLMLKGNYKEFKWCRDQQKDGHNPYTGIKAYLYEGEGYNES